MTLRIQFSGNVRKSETKNVGGKTLVELQLCQKNYAKKDDEPTFTWLRINVWEPKDFQLPRLNVGCFVAGSGEFSLRSFTNKDNAKQQSAECRCTSFDIDGPRQDQPAPQAAPAPATKSRVPYGGGVRDEDQPPFARDYLLEMG